MGHHSHEEIQKEIRKYYVIFGALAALTIITVAISYVHLPITIAITLALIVALTKGGLVCCFFMHLISERKVIYLFLIITVTFFMGIIYLPYFEFFSIPEGSQHTHTAVTFKTEGHSSGH